MSLKHILIYVLLVLSISDIYCQRSYEQDDSLLNRQLGKFQLQFKDLMNTRGIPWYQTKEINVQTLIKALSEYNNKSNTGILFYYHQGDTLYCWLINYTGIIASAISIVSPKHLLELETDLKNRLRVDFSTPILADDRGLKINRDYQARDNFRFYSDEISKTIIPKKVAEKLASMQYVIVVPELNISAIPLYLLQPFGDSTYLIEKTTIVIAHSLDEFLNRVYYIRHKLLSFEDDPNIDFTPDSPLIVGNPDFSACQEYQSLIGAEKEAEQAANKFAVKPLIGSAATKEEVLKRIKHSEFIYLATHGVADANDPLNKSHLVFTGDKSHCGFWTAKEIQFDTLQYQAIVVLSACQTGLGKALDAGIIGLGRGFIKAHASNVIMSLWSVHDNATMDFMNIFTDELFVSQPFFPAENLRHAILRYKKTNPNPADWAAFVDMGTPYPPDILIKLKIK